MMVPPYLHIIQFHTRPDLRYIYSLLAESIQGAPEHQVQQILSQVSEISKLKEQLRQANAKLEKRRRGTCLPVVMPPRRPS